MMVKQCRCYRVKCVHQHDDFDCSECIDTPDCKKLGNPSYFELEVDKKLGDGTMTDAKET
jgi:hypothetical protein